MQEKKEERKLCSNQRGLSKYFDNSFFALKLNKFLRSLTMLRR